MKKSALGSPFSLACSAALVLVAAPVCAQQAPPPRADSAATELEAGRPWHAAVLRDRTLDVATLEPSVRLHFARAETGARRWSEVIGLLQGAPWLAELEGGAGMGLLARAFEEEERWSEARDAYRRYLALPAAEEGAQPVAARVRLARASLRADGGDEALSLLAEIDARNAAVADWAALDAARVAAAEADAGSVRALLATVDGAETLARGALLEARALIAANDSAGAEAALEGVVARLGPGALRGEAWSMLGELRDRRGADDAAAEAYRLALSEGAPADAGGRAARGLLDIGGLDAAGALEVARALERAGDGARALRAYDLHASLAGGAPSGDVRLTHARLLADVAARQDEAVAIFGELQTSPELGPAALDLWIHLRDRQGRTADALTLRERLMERFPGSAEAANTLFLRGDAAHDRAQLDEALADYRRLVGAAPSTDRAGLARMRWAQIHLHRGEVREATEVFEGYRSDFPTGRRWEEATYWAARGYHESGDAQRARERIVELRAREPFGYYAVLAAELLGEPFTIDVPEGEEPPFPEWVREDLATLERLEAAGLDEGVEWQVQRLRARAREAPAAEALRVSEELTARGHSLDGINAAWQIRERGEPWSERLLRAVYPFPGPERVTREAAERGLDPILVAALIRQESAWEPAIGSRVGARGLMQIMPETGQQLHRAHGVGDFDPDMLTVADLNLHLGTAYLAELLDRYDGNLPLALSGYNAGPHRADVWQDFPEAADPLRLTERIPFAETRDYVKLIRRNLAIYRALYGELASTR